MLFVVEAALITVNLKGNDVTLHHQVDIHLAMSIAGFTDFTADVTTARLPLLTLLQAPGFTEFTTD